MSIIVNTSALSLQFSGKTYPCRIGRKGFIAGERGREGDEKTPLGHYFLRFGLYRKDRLPKPNSALTFRPIRQDDGWCDAPEDSAYNRLIRLPYPTKGKEVSHEKLWRTDGAYDVILVISHNDSPPIPGHGSAVFIHIAQPDDRKTLGCVAVTPDVMVDLFRYIKTDMPVIIQA